MKLTVLMTTLILAACGGAAEAGSIGSRRAEAQRQSSVRAARQLIASRDIRMLHRGNYECGRSSCRVIRPNVNLTISLLGEMVRQNNQ